MTQTATWWDLIIVGSGPAGSAAAVAARWANPSARVLLLDRRRFPRDKCCGDAVLNDGIVELARHGVSQRALLQGYQPTRSLQLITTTGRRVFGRLPGEMTVIPRAVFDARLLAAAVDSGAVWRQHRVRSVADRGSYVEVDGHLRARVVIGADGAESSVRRCAAATTPRELAVALRGYERADGREPRAPEMAFEPRGRLSYAWRFPASTGVANVGYGHLLRPGEHADRAALLDSLHRLLPDVQPDATSLRAARLPLSTSRQSAARGRVLLTGDAAALVNPLSGEGIYYAISSGLAAGRAAATIPARAAAVYGKWLRRRFGVHHAHAGVLAALTSSSRVLEAGLLAAGENPSLFTDLARLGLADGRITGRLAVGLGRQLLINGWSAVGRTTR